MLKGIKNNYENIIEINDKEKTEGNKNKQKKHKLLEGLTRIVEKTVGIKHRLNRANICLNEFPLNKINIMKQS